MYIVYPCMPRRSVPVAWAVDPLLAEMFPALWNFFASSATANDTFVAGVDGAGYVFVAELGGHEEACVSTIVLFCVRAPASNLLQHWHKHTAPKTNESKWLLARRYEQRAGRVLAEIGPNVVDTGVAVAGWADGACCWFCVVCVSTRFLLHVLSNGVWCLLWRAVTDSVKRGACACELACA